MTTNITGRQRKHLRGLAHTLDPVVHVGDSGLSTGVLVGIDRALEDHELVKVRFVGHRGEKKELCARIERDLECSHVGTIGHVAILYRPARDNERRRIALP